MIRVAIAGLGAASQTIHLPALKKAAGLALCGGSDPDPAARGAFVRAAGGGIRAEADLETLLAREHPEWVVVAAPPAHHRELCVAALTAGAHVLCEKPFGASLEDADAILAAAARTGRQVAVNLEYPHMPIFAAALAQAGKAGFGRPLFIQAWQQVDQPPGREAGWRQEGQTLREFGCHVIDLMLRLYGEPPTRVYARTPRPLPVGTAEIIDIVVLDFPGERAAVMVLDRACRGRHRYLEMRVDGEEASLRASIGGRAGLSVYLNARTRRPGMRLALAGGGRAWLETGERTRLLATNPVDAFAAATAAHLEAVVAAVAAGQEPPASGRQAREVMAVVAAAYASARSGEPVALEAGTPP